MSRDEPAPRAKRRRSKDGCRPCRIRKKKCDGRKPSCVSCERNVLLCSWFSSPDDNKKQGSPATPCITTEYSLGPSDRKRKFSISSSPYPDTNDDICLSSPSTSVWDQEFSSPPVFRTNADILDIPKLLRQPTLEPIFRSPISLLLYQHWVERTGDVMSAHRGPFNAFVTELPRLAIAYPDTVLQGLLACSGIHYCNGGKTPDVEASTYTHLGLALRSLKYGLTRLVENPSTDPIPLLATALVLCFVETTRGDVNGVLSHHIKAAHILFNTLLASPSLLQLDESMLEFLKEFYIYIARITEISSGSLSIDLQNRDTAEKTPLREFSWVSRKSYGMLVGCAYELFDMIPQISALARRKRKKPKQQPNDPIQPDDYESEPDQLSHQHFKSRVLAWQPPADARQDFVACGLIYQQALLCYLDTSFADPPITAHTPLPAFVHEHFESLKNLLATLPLDAPISHTLCWPLALFGSLAREQEQRDMIVERLQAMWDLLKLGNVMATMNLLRRLWDDTGHGPPDVNKPAAASLTDDESAAAVVVATTSSKRRRVTKKVYDTSDMEALMKRYGLMVCFA